MITLETGGLKVDLEVVGYEPNNEDDWCGVDFHAYGNGIDIRIDAMSDSLMNSELETLTKYLELALNGKLKKSRRINCIEYDFDFLVSEYKNLYIKVNVLNDNRNTDNYLLLNFEEEESQKLYEYLTKEIGILSKLGDLSDTEKLYRYVSVVYDPEDVREYTYLDEDHVAEFDARVWVPVGKDNKEKIAYVVDINDYAADKVPYPLDKVKKILRIAKDTD